MIVISFVLHVVLAVLVVFLMMSRPPLGTSVAIAGVALVLALAWGRLTGRYRPVARAAS